ncbi:MAG: hypothetical protein QXI32_06095 [Candidatus Bathyarchaeia archaeon]
MEEVGRVRLSVFTGTKARLNRVILGVLAQHGPLTISDLRKRIRTLRDFRYTRYSVIHRRIHALQEEGFLEVVGIDEMKKSFVYGLTPRGKLAILLDKLDFDKVLCTADMEKIAMILNALS